MFDLRFSIPLLATLVFTLCLGVKPSLAEEEIKVFSLQHANCIEMAKILNILAEGELVIAPDKRTNSLVIVETQDSLSVIEAIVQKLDQPVKKRPGASAKPVSKATKQKHTKSVIAANAKDISAKKNASAQANAQRIAEEIAAANEHLRMHDQKRALTMQADLAKRTIELMERRISQGKAEQEIKKMMLETEVKNTEEKYRAQKERVVSLEAQHNAGTASSGQVSVAHAEATATQRMLPILQQQLELFKKHTMPLEQLQLQLEASKAKQELQQLQTAISRAEQVPTKPKKAHRELR